MGEESFYTDGVKEYRENSRFPTLSRYRDLINFLKNVFKDGVVTFDELRIVEQVERDILLEYELAYNICSQIPPYTKRRAAAERLLNHLYRCFVVMSYAKDRAKVQNKQYQEKLKTKKGVSSAAIDRVLRVKVDKVQLDMLQDIESQRKVVFKELPRIRRNLTSLTAEERVEYEGQINAALDHLEKINHELLNVRDINRLLGLEKYLKDEKERTRE